MTTRSAPERSRANMSTVVDAIATLDDKLSTQIAGLASGLNQLTEAHHRAMLEQERRNATFATAARLDAIDAKLSTFLSEDSGRAERLRSIESRLNEHGRAISSLQTSTNTRQIQGLNQLSTWLVQTLIVLSSTVLAFILYHAVFH